MARYQEYKKQIEDMMANATGTAYKSKEMVEAEIWLANELQLIKVQEEESREYLSHLDQLGKAFTQGFYTWEQYEDRLEHIKKYYGR